MANISKKEPMDEHEKFREIKIGLINIFRKTRKIKNAEKKRKRKKK